MSKDKNLEKPSLLFVNYGRSFLSVRRLHLGSNAVRPQPFTSSESSRLRHALRLPTSCLRATRTSSTRYQRRPRTSLDSACRRDIRLFFSNIRYGLMSLCLHFEARSLPSQILMEVAVASAPVSKSFTEGAMAKSAKLQRIRSASRIHSLPSFSARFPVTSSSQAPAGLQPLQISESFALISSPRSRRTLHTPSLSQGYHRASTSRAKWCLLEPDFEVQILNQLRRA